MHAMKKTLHQWLVRFLFHFCFQFPFSVSSFHFISFSWFPIWKVAHLLHTVRNTSAAIVQAKNRWSEQPLKRTRKLFTFVAATLSDRNGNRCSTNLWTASPIVLLMVIPVKEALSLGIRKRHYQKTYFVNRTISLTRGASSTYYSSCAVIGHFTCQTAMSLGRVGCRIVTRPLFLLMRGGVWARD